MSDGGRRERIERRALGAVRCLDATTALPIGRPLAIAALGVRVVRNRRADYVITAAPGLAEHDRVFAGPPAVPAVGSLAVVLTIEDPSGAYLSRRRTVRLPRDPDPAHAEQDGSLFRAVEVAMFPAPAAKSAPGWAVVRASVRRPGSTVGLPGALLRVVRAADGVLLASGLSDGRGEALVAVPGIPITTWGEGDGAVLATELDATLEVVIDPAAGAVADPDDLEARRAALPSGSAAVKLASGRAVTRTVEVTVS